MNQEEISALLNSSVATSTASAATSTAVATSTEHETTLDAASESTEPGDVTNAITETVGHVAGSDVLYSIDVCRTNQVQSLSHSRLNDCAALLIQADLLLFYKRVVRTITRLGDGVDEDSGEAVT